MGWTGRGCTCHASAGRRRHNKLFAIAGNATRNCGKALESCLESPTMTSLDGLPDDPFRLREAVLATRAELDAERALRQQLEDQNERLRHFIRQLQRMQFGRRSEKLDPDQLNLALEDLEQSTAEADAEAEKAAPQVRQSRGRERRQSRGALPQHLPRIEVVVEPETTVCPCCSGPMHLIGEDRSERLDVIPMRYQVVVTRRPKYGCRVCQSAVVQAPAPPRLIEGGLPTERMVAHVLVAKYADHAPLYRQAQMLARQGISIDRSTLASWVGYAAAELKPLWRLLRDQLLAAAKLFVDETTAPVLDPGRGRTKTGYFWAIARDDRPWSGADPPAVIYSYAPGRGNEHAAALLKDFRGILQTDAYVAYKAVAKPPDTEGGTGEGVILRTLLGALPTAVLRDRAQGTGADRPRGPAADRGAVRDRGGDPRPECRTAAGRPAAADKAAAR